MLFRSSFTADPRIQKRTVTVKEVVRLVLKSAVETGTPFAFNRDTVNRLNPNGHAGVIYCSNLCTEIAQNTSAIQEVTREVRTEDGDTVVVTTTRPGDFVVCNLASLSLGRLPVEDDAAMGRVIETAVRALDNVIDLNFYPLEYARLTNQKYRSIGLGVSGYHHMLAKRGIRWESEEHLAFTDAVFEHINYAAVKADTALAREKGRYALFEGSDWQTGAYFEKRGYTSEKWQAIAETVAEGAGQDLLSEHETRCDASGNKALGDITGFLRAKIAEYFSAKKIPYYLKYIDPSYMIRSVPANANDRLYCGFLGQHAVHAAMSGKTGMVVANIMDKFVHLPLELVTRKRRTMSVRSDLWQSVLETTGQGDVMGTSPEPEQHL